MPCDSGRDCFDKFDNPTDEYEKEYNSLAKEYPNDTRKNDHFQKLRPNPIARSTYNILRCRKKTQQPCTALPDVE